MTKRDSEDRDAIAVIDAAGIHPYRRLFEVAGSAMAQLERCTGAAPAIAVRGSHGLAVHAAILAGLLRGRRIVFLDPAADVASLGVILAALGVSVVLDASAVPAAPLPGIEVHDVHAIREERGAGSVVGASVTCEDYAILTTGTTGEPKVIVQTIANLRAHIANYAGYVGVRPGDRILQLASAGWDAGLMDIFACLWHGGVLCSINPRAHDVAAVRSFIAEHAIGVLHMTVPYFRLVHAAYPAPIRLVLGGELIVRRDLERFDRVAPAGSVVFNAYGPTECTTALYNLHRAGEPIVGDTWPLACSVDGVAAELVRDGEVIREVDRSGELMVGSVLLARRFDPATAVAIDLDTTAVDGARYYGTGDLAHRDEHGRIVITGRKDTVIKVNGQKVSLHEVETVVRALPEVADACVVARPDQIDATVIAAIVPADPTADVTAIRRALAARLAPHKLPKQLLLVPALALNQNNKVDRARILTLAAEAAAVPGPASSPAEPLIAEIAKGLRGAAVDPALSFVENGGDSLRALSVVAALKRRGHRLSLEALVSATPIGQLVLGDAPAPGGTATPADASAGVLPNRVFLESRGIPDLNRWCQTAVFDHTGGRDAKTIAEVLEAVLARHAASWPGARPRVEVIEAPDLRATVATIEATISRAAGRLCAAAVVLGERGPHVVVSSHQFHVDRASWILLLAELSDGTRDGVAAVRAWPPPSPGHAAWTALYQQQRAGERASEVWAALPWERCTDLVDADAPFPRREVFRRTSFDLGRFGGTGTGSALEQVNHALLAAVVSGLAEITGNRWQKLDLLEHGRDLTIGGVDPHGIVGWFTVIHPLVMHVAEDAAAVARAVAAHAARVRPFAHTFGNEHHGRGRLRCDVSYNFLGELEIASTSEYAVNPLSLETMHGAASHRLELTGHVWQERVQLVIDHDPAVLDRATIARLSDRIVRAFAAVAEA